MCKSLFIQTGKGARRIWSVYHWCGDDGGGGQGEGGAGLNAVDEKYDRFELADCEYGAGAGDAVFVSCRLSLQFAGDRYGMSRAAYWVFHVDAHAGRVRSFRSFRDRGEALAAAGLA